ncbi:type IV toxin-antitoxin system AbiEi family antitoxin [Leifsonia sp. 22587]|uniref:type IV toxin-antitoxin system AbiEi family antitoxin n=1 Tax=Leifsonia sp. 22587 TaxID=3453946 RepID=UPI003F8767A2
MTTITAPLLDSSVLPLPELLSLCLDGQLYRVGDAFAPPGEPDVPELRAHSLSSTLPGWAIADRGSAAWVHGTRAMMPPLPQVCIPPHHRGGLGAAGLDAWHRSLLPDEVMTVGPISVTTPLRTAIDLLSDPSGFGDAAALEIRHLLALAELTPAQLDAALRSRRRKGCALARSRLPAVARTRLPAPDAVRAA